MNRERKGRRWGGDKKGNGKKGVEENKNNGEEEKGKMKGAGVEIGVERAGGGESGA